MTNVKQINRSAVLQLLLRNGGMSRTDLAEELNLTTATLTS
ncbi:winged helix-turn-helix transcriptional regulator, partial [Anaerotruncus massiliensis (ex Togo et al. 2019)]